MQRQSFVEFQKGGPFYDLVGAFLIAISSSPAIFNEDNPMGLTSEQYVTISAVVGTRSTSTHSMFSEKFVRDI
jgi:hypothetical protein